MQEFVGFIVLIVAGAIAAVTKEFDSVMYGSVGVFVLSLLFLDWRGKRAQVPPKDKVDKEVEEKSDPEQKGLTTGLFTNYYR